MEQQQVEQLIAIYCNKLPLEAINVIKEKILTRTTTQPALS